MKFEIKPFESVGNLVFGITKDQVREVLGNQFNLVPERSVCPDYPAEFYTKFNVFVYYGSDGKAVSYEFTNDSDLYFKGIGLFSMPMNEIISMLKGIDSNPRIDNAGIDFLALGISLYIPLEEKIEAIMVSKKGYFG